MDLANRPQKDITTPSGYQLKVVEFVTLRDEQNLTLEMARTMLPTGRTEVKNEQELMANRMTNFINETNSWLGIIILSLTCPDGKVITGRKEIETFILEELPTYIGEEIKAVVTDVISPKKTTPTATNTSLPAEGKPQE